MTYLLDTNAWIHLFSLPTAISASARKALSTETEFALATISLVEVCQKEATGKLHFRSSLSHWLEKALPDNQVRLLAITPEIAREAYALGPGFHKDPADRLIVATVRIHGLTLVTSDQKLIGFKGVNTLSTR
ncbi:MAG TPA: type II toxin-antitoxin system VapC family toxin [Verrucomicrobiales bacterium]|nr:type II toxin-antitoxin system VapC family toxin [Verrucomicrobiales bacterium]